MKLKTQHRFLTISPQDLDAKARTMRFPFSSETTVDRAWGGEVLVHDPASVRLQRLNSRAQLLFNHDVNDVIGVVEHAQIGGDRRGYATVRFAKTARAEEILSMVQDGILANVSFAYRIHAAEETPGNTVYRVTDWEPLEVSIVTVPADPSVGVGRSFVDDEIEVRIERTASTPADVADPQPAFNAVTQEVIRMDMQVPAAVQNAEVRNDGTEIERLRIKTINTLARQHKVDDKTRDEWIDAGTTGDEAAQKVLDILAERSRSNPQTEAKVGLSSKEIKNYSLMRAIQAAADKNWNKAGLELEVSREIAKRMNRMPDEYSFFVPFEVQQRDVQKRDLTVGTAGAGGYLVETQNVGFVELLRNRSVAFNVGARRLSGLQGNLTIPKQSAAATAYWLSTEATAITESQQTFAQISMSPKTVGAYTEISRQLLLQSSPDAEGLVTSDLANVVALAVDLAVLNGSGASGQPTGILNTAGIGAVTGTSLDYADVLEFQTDVAAANVVPASGAYVTTPAVAALMMQRARFTSTDTPLWEGNIWDGRMSGFRAMSSNQIPAATMLFGDFSQVVVGEWGVLEIAINPQANFPAGIIGVRAMYSVDVAVRYASAFSAASSIT